LNTNETLLKKLPRHPRTGKIFTIATRKGGGMGWHEICLGSINGKARAGHTEKGNTLFAIEKFKEFIDIHNGERPVIIDCGANIGEMSVHWSDWVKEIHAFEPIPWTHEVLKTNIDDNHCANVIPHNVALSDKNQTLTMRFNEQSNDTAKIGVFTRKYKNDEILEVKCKSLDSYNFEQVDFIKIDAEGHELFVLQGAIETIKRCNPIIQAEVEEKHLKSLGLTRDDVGKFLTNLGYKIYEKQNLRSFAKTHEIQEIASMNEARFKDVLFIK
jgi:FkbM family methyltransferase